MVTLTRTVPRMGKSGWRVCMTALFAMWAYLLSGVHTAYAQTASATLSGTVSDEKENAVPGASVALINNATGVRRTAAANDNGYFTVPLLPPGIYTVRIEKPGFAPLEARDVILNVGDERALRIQLKVASMAETVTVDANAETIRTDAAVATVVDRQFVQNLPLNGRSFQSLIGLTPGVVFVSAAGASGQFTVNGQRSDANYLTVDGVSSNIGTGTFSNSLAQAAGGTLPGVNAQGGTNGLISVDALQEFKIQTSTYAAEFGRQPGGQIQVVSRSGANQFHSTLFEYFRNDALDAHDWFVNANRLPNPPLRQSQFGGTFSGPVMLPRFGAGGRQPGYNGRNRTFFFFNYEALRLRLPQAQANISVPSLSLRQDPALKPEIRQLLNALPLPTGPENVTTRSATFNAGYSDPSSSNATSIRIDHMVASKLALFGRYDFAPSDTQSRVQSLSTINSTQVELETLTIGGTITFSSKLTNEVRANWSRNKARSIAVLDNFFGAVPPPDSLLFPAPFASAQASQIVVSLPSGSFIAGRNAENPLRQINLVDNLLVTSGAHTLKFGIDHRRISSVFGPFDYNSAVQFLTPAQVLAGVASSITINSRDQNILIFNDLSVYGQDTWKINRRLTVDYGLRWEFNPHPHLDKGELVTLTGLDDPATIAIAPAGNPIYRTRYNNFAPRVGMAYQLRRTAGWETVARGGFGIFYDLGTGTSGSIVGGFPYVRKKTLSNSSFPLDATSASPAAPLSLTPPYSSQSFTAFDPGYVLPRTYEWNVAIEQSLGKAQTLSATYVGAAGRRLLRLESFLNPNPSFVNSSTVSINRTFGRSDYNALQLQLNRRLSRRFQALASYTWSHSIDNASSDSFPNARSDRIDPNTDRGSSDFDVRHAFSAAATYDIPAPQMNSLLRAVLRDWGVDAVVKAQSAIPVNVTVIRDLGFGQQALTFRPDLIVGIPLYLNDPTVAASRRINPAAFVVSPDLRQGTLGRNALSGLPRSQVDLSLRRQFNLTERIKLQFRGDLFNVLNHPNFTSPNGNSGSFAGGRFFPSSTFGIATSMLNRGLFGLSPLYQLGGPRDVQLSLRLSF